MESQIAEVIHNQGVKGKKIVKTSLDFFYHWEKTIPQKVYLRQPTGKSWKEYSWKETSNQVRRMVAALKAMNLPAHSNVGIVSKNCAHWIMSDLAILMAGHVSVPFYPTLTADKLNEVLVHSGTKVLFVGKLDNWAGMKDGIPGDVTCITYPDSPANNPNYLKWDDLIAKNEPFEGEYIPQQDELCTIIYTSGTTGMPKGVMHTYYTMSYMLEEAAPILKLSSNDDKFFSYLPLCHIAERQIVEAASLLTGGTVSFVENLDTFKDNLAEVQPTHFLAVPRIWTKFQLGILEKMPQKKLNTLMSIPIISGLVKKKIKKALGMANARLILTGAAPMPPNLLKWYHKLGIQIQEAYGMTENGGCCTLMRTDKAKIGTVGQAYPGCEIKIEPTTNEVLMKAEWVMTGYYKEKVITDNTLKDGWLHTGDMGELDKDGFLKITGRVKDQFKSAKGEFVVPGPIESAIVGNSCIEQICLVGRGLPQPVALVVLSEIGKKMETEEKAALIESFEQTLKEVNAQALNHEKVEKIIVVKEAWSVENNMLTPTLKIKRNVLEDVYGFKLDKWFEEKGKVIWEA